MTVMRPWKATVVQSMQRSLSPSIARKGQFSQPFSTNCSRHDAEVVTRCQCQEL